MATSTAAKNAMLTTFAGNAVYASLHSGTADPSGSNEITGGTPAYARQSVTWGTAASASVASSNSPQFNVPAGTTIQYVGLWTAATGGTYYGSFAITNETFGAQGTYTVTSITETLT